MTEEEIFNLEQIQGQKQYDLFINKCKEKELLGFSKQIYTEVHHIIPECMGGKTIKSNLCRMTIEDHIIAHLILTRVYPTHAGILWGALVMLKCSNNGKRTETQKLFSQESFEKVKFGLKSQNLTGIPRKLKKKTLDLNNIIDENIKVLLSKPKKKYVKWNSEIISKMSLSKTGKNHNLFGSKHKESTKKKMSESQKGIKNHFYGKHHSSLTIDKISFSKTHYVQSPDGTIYKTIGEAAKAAVMSRDKLSSWLYSNDTHGYKWIDKNS